MERPRHGGEGALELFGQISTEERTAAPIILQCVAGDGETLRIGVDGRPWHTHCEPADVGLTDAPTSRAAARSARTGPESPLARLILAELRERGHRGATDSELQLVFHDQPPGSCAKRRLDLVRHDLVRDSGRVRDSRYGRSAIVWVALNQVSE